MRDGIHRAASGSDPPHRRRCGSRWAFLRWRLASPAFSCRCCRRHRSCFWRRFVLRAGPRDARLAADASAFWPLWSGIGARAPCRAIAREAIGVGNDGGELRDLGADASRTMDVGSTGVLRHGGNMVCGACRTNSPCIAIQLPNSLICAPFGPKAPPNTPPTLGLSLISETASIGHPFFGVPPCRSTDKH